MAKQIGGNEFLGDLMAIQATLDDRVEEKDKVIAMVPWWRSVRMAAAAVFLLVASMALLWLLPATNETTHLAMEEAPTAAPAEADSQNQPRSLSVPMPEEEEADTESLLAEEIATPAPELTPKTAEESETVEIEPVEEPILAEAEVFTEDVDALVEEEYAMVESAEADELVRGPGLGKVG